MYCVYIGYNNGIVTFESENMEEFIFPITAIHIIKRKWSTTTYQIAVTGMNITCGISDKEARKILDALRIKLGVY